jgi:predicted O-methyltransferase YrrM
MKAYSVPGLSTEKDLDIIYEWATAVPINGIIVEVGSMFGRTAVAFAEGAHSSVKIYCIDYFDEYTQIRPLNSIEKRGGSDIDFWQPDKIYNKEIEFSRFTEEYKNIIPLKLDSDKKVYLYDKEPIDLLFLDCAHKNPDDIMNIVYFIKFLKYNALICGHDYYDDGSNRFSDVRRNVAALEKFYNTTVTRYADSSMWSIRVRQ